MGSVMQRNSLISGKGVAIMLLIMSASLVIACAKDIGMATQPEGFGALTQGGEGGRTVIVTNLSDDGPGSLREALTAQGPRIVEFSVEGTIELKSRIQVTSGQVTIDGSTAPSDGITIMNHGIHFVGDCNDIIVRHLRIRVLTGGSSGDCLLSLGPVTRCSLPISVMIYTKNGMRGNWAYPGKIAGCGKNSHL